MGGRAVLGRARAEVGQASWFLRRYRDPSRVRTQLRVVRNLDVPRLPRVQRGRHSIWAVGVVRDEADVVGHTVRHLLAQGVDQVVVADNGSVDGTRELLFQLSRDDDRVHVVPDREKAHHQAEKMTWLAHLAWRRGAGWVVPFDADEFLFAPDSDLASFLGDQEASTVHAAFHHMVPERAATSIGPDTTFVLDASPSSPGKVVARAHPLLEIGPGNHSASRVGSVTTGLSIAHAIYRSPEQVARKLRQGHAAIQAGSGRWAGTHWEKGSRLDDREVAEVWSNISAGRPDSRIDYLAAGPMVRVRPLGWSTWDPDGALSGARSTGASGVVVETGEQAGGTLGVELPREERT